MVEKTDDEKVSIWSTGDKERIWLISLASAFFYTSLILILWHNWYKIIEVDYDTIVEVINAIGSASLAAIALAFFIIEGVNLMIIPVEKYRQKQRQEGREEGRQEASNEWLEWFKKVSAEHPDIPMPPFIENESTQNGSAADSKWLHREMKGYLCDS